MKRADVFLSCLMLALSVIAQTSDSEFEYGKPEELKGLTRLFVDTGGDLKNHGRITKEIEKARLPNIVIVGGSQEAEVVLRFRRGVETELSATTRPIYGTNRTRTDVDEQKMEAGTGLVFIPKGIRLRVLMDFSDVQKVFEKKPATNFAKTFIKAYKKANGLK